ncbi:unnamed protein product [Euphydryas editha]|uniref:Reverse transcriptase n=1 Tax=Euphydryas editha TaxID=104508 RepID=A0AAU9VFA5_EUPED|nr:unnamed protein product [Euphydryas editha]
MKSITTSCDASMPLKELKNAAMTLKLGKAPGPKGIPTLVIKTTTQDFPDLILNACNACLATGTFATVWKRQRLVLLDKGKGTPLTPSSFRPLCMLDTAGKLLEKLIQAKLRSDIGSVGGFAESQHGLRKRRSTIGAIKKVIGITAEAWFGNLKSHSLHPHHVIYKERLQECKMG